ncbi:hypothetical protein A2W13_00465 [Candidatus Woesebacteria bacterium RBG_16_36_11]|uniref:Uncharacterized protein n=3 Tax=Candidatus Woeseibacteriota TaxID=1752722 RepID=A0A1F7X761_9BACT|nr:MAG: hypothetical protein A2Z67_01320 [Candidatus Woesebacteria bacterium RBG_13_36_22]OGM10904.1 MAG: hypothetical protein A2W13_00465 [Candidatus Woesebacteria bacterium RBG_16_36_11]OGM16874.1 MAG: hypothetical protein A2V55_02860 [Candidatus Woesebacteria bacterium RBG_19FT_COMBO_37_29]
MTSEVLFTPQNHSTFRKLEGVYFGSNFLNPVDLFETKVVVNKNKGKTYINDFQASANTDGKFIDLYTTSGCVERVPLVFIEDVKELNSYSNDGLMVLRLVFPLSNDQITAFKTVNDIQLFSC